MYPDRFPRETIAQKATVPDTEFFLPDTVHADQAEQQFHDLIEPVRDGDTVIITHNDADGLASGAYMESWINAVSDDGSVTVYPTGYRSPCNLPRALELLAEYHATNLRVVVTDLGASLFEESEPAIKTLSEDDVELVWIDHHQWDTDTVSVAQEYGSIVVDDSFCATKLITELRNGEHSASNDIPLPTDGVPESQAELATVVNDHDLWIKEDDRSDRFATFAYFADDDTFMDAVLTGVDLFDEYQEEITTYQAENDAMQAYCVENATYEMVAGYEVGFAYGYGPSSDVGNELVEGEGAAIAVVIRPDGSLSFYAHSDETGFTDCHVVAEAFDGGGHPTAAGGQLPVTGFDEYLSLWSEESEAYRDVLTDAIHEVIASDNAY